MSGHTLLKKVLVERERAVDRKESVNAGFFLATSFLLAALSYSTLTYLVAQPAFSRGAEHDVVKAVSVVQDTNSLSEPESGVKLLLSIFSRLGSGPQLAMGQRPEGPSRWTYAPNAWGAKGKSFRARGQSSDADLNGSQAIAPQQQFGQGLIATSADPALSIRPQLSKRAASDDAANANLIASAGASAGAGAPAQDSAFNSLGGSSKVVSENPYIKEFSLTHKVENASDLKQKSWYGGKTQINIVDEPLGKARLDHANLIEHARDGEKGIIANSSAENVNGIIRPSEQPGLFKYVREYMKDSPKNMPAPALPATLQAEPMTYGSASESSYGTAAGLKENSDNGARLATASTRGAVMHFDARPAGSNSFSVSNLKARALKKSGPTQIAFLPPNAVHGINGLALGATAAETNTFFKSRGKINKAVISGFQILTLKNERGSVTLQAFIRDGRLEALRVFSGVYAPAQLGISLGEDLPTMKATFGEPAFILEEPKSEGKAAGVLAKNYVYPISQVSFQLSRPAVGATPQVLSMLLFKFL